MPTSDILLKSFTYCQFSNDLSQLNYRAHYVLRLEGVLGTAIVINQSSRPPV